MRKRGALILLVLISGLYFLTPLSMGGVLSWDVHQSWRFFSGNTSSTGPIYFANNFTATRIQITGGLVEFSGFNMGDSWGDFGISCVDAMANITVESVTPANLSLRYVLDAPAGMNRAFIKGGRGVAPSVVTGAFNYTYNAGTDIIDLFHNNTSPVTVRITFPSSFLLTVHLVSDIAAGLEGGYITVWNGTGTIYLDITNSTGYTSAHDLDVGDYSVLAEREFHNPRLVSVALTANNILEIVLSTNGGLMVFNIEVALLALIAVGFALIHLRSQSIPAGLVSTIFSFGTVLIWLGARAPVPALSWLFAIFGAVILISTGRSFIEWWGDNRSTW